MKTQRILQVKLL